jgi:hypothetical protein
MNLSRGQSVCPQGLKPTFLGTLNGAAEAVPFPKPVLERLFLPQAATNNTP